MAKGISEFKSKLVKGGARPNLFLVRLNFPSLQGIVDIGTDSSKTATETAEFMVKTRTDSCFKSWSNRSSL